MANSYAGDGRDKEPRAFDAAAVPVRAGSKQRGQLRYSLPWVAILFITAGFHFYRGVPLDGWIFLGVGAVVAIDLVVTHASRPPAPRSRVSSRWRKQLLSRLALRVILLLVGAGAMAVVVLAPAGSLGIAAAVGLVGAVMLLLAWPQNHHVQQQHQAQQGVNTTAMHRAAWWWGAVLLFLALWELGTYFTDDLDPAVAPVVPPLTDLLQPLFDGDASRWFMMALWLVACAGLLRVARRP